MSDQKLPGNVLRVDVGCACHNEKKASHTDFGLPFECHGAFSLLFPVRVFEPSGELEYRQMRQSWVRDSLAIFDKFYEDARKNLMQHEPMVIRPQRQGRALAVIDAEDMVAASSGNGDDHDEQPEDSGEPLKEQN